LPSLCRSLNIKAFVPTAESLETNHLIVFLRRPTMLVVAGYNDIGETRFVERKFKFYHSPPPQAEEFKFSVNKPSVPPMLIAQVGNGGLRNEIRLDPIVS
jgi:hypothetical protein